jgi:hypothetical protein
MEGGAIDLNMAPTSDEEEEERQESAVDTLRRVSYIHQHRAARPLFIISLSLSLSLSLSVPALIIDDDAMMR